MKVTDNKNYRMPEADDKVLVNDLNMNATMIDRDITVMNNSLATKAPISSPKFVGEPMAPKPGVDGQVIYERIATVGNITDALTVEVL